MVVVNDIDYEILQTNAVDEGYRVFTLNQTYQKDERVIHKGIIYIAAANLTALKDPNIDINNWVEAGYANSLRLKDKFINTQTISDGELKFTIDTKDEFFNVIAFLNTDATSINIVDKNKVCIYNQTTSKREVSHNWWEYFFAFRQKSKKDNIKLDNKILYRGVFEVTITPGKNGARVGHLLLGKKEWIGKALIKPKVSIIDYSKKVVDDWGNAFFRKGKTAKYADIAVVMESNEVDGVRELLESCVGEPRLYITDESNRYESLNIYGSFSSLDILIENHDYSELNISIEGII